MTAEHLEFYVDNEYAVIHDFMPKKLLEDYSSFLGRALEQDVWPMFAHAGIDPSMPDLATQVSNLIAQESEIDPALKQVLLGQFPLAVRLSEKIKPIARYLGESDLLKKLLGSGKLFMHMPPMMRFVPPNYTPAAVPAHQDSSYNTHMSGFLTVWVPLVRIDSACGGLVIFEDSQHVVSNVAPEYNGWLRPVPVDGFKRKQLEGLEPGDVVLLSPNIVHASAPNISHRTRLSMDIRIFGEKTHSSKHHMNLQTLETIAV